MREHRPAICLNTWGPRTRGCLPRYFTDTATWRVVPCIRGRAPPAADPEHWRGGVGIQDVPSNEGHVGGGNEGGKRRSERLRWQFAKHAHGHGDAGQPNQIPRKRNSPTRGPSHFVRWGGRSRRRCGSPRSSSYSAGSTQVEIKGAPGPCSQRAPYQGTQRKSQSQHHRSALEHARQHTPSEPSKSQKHSPPPSATKGEALKPGPAVFSTTNLTSLHTQQASLLALPADVVGCQEVRLDEPGQRRQAEELKTAGLSIIFGKPLKRRTPTSRLPAGGVAIAARPALNLRAVPPNCPASQALWDTTRFCHGVVCFEGQVVHVISFYGFTNAARHPEQRRANESLLKQMFAFLACLGDVPIVILGDFNVPPDRSVTLSAILGQGAFFDLATIHSAQHDSQPQNTCFAHETSAGTRIDSEQQSDGSCLLWGASA